MTGHKWFRVPPEEVYLLFKSGMAPVDIARAFGVHRATISRAIRKVAPGADLRTGKVRRLAAVRPMTERQLRALSHVIDGTWYPPEEPQPVPGVPCPRCGVKSEHHAEHGCRRWSPPLQ